MKTDRFFEISVFVQVAQMGTFSAAARLMSLDPSTVSKVIARLEQRLGVALFSRTSRAVKLTAEGQEFLDSAVQLLEDLDYAESRLKSQTDSPRGILRVGAHPTITTMILARMLPEFIRQNPGVEIEISVWGWPVTGLSTETLEGNVDVAVLSGAFSDSSMVARKVGVSRRVICAAPSYLEAHGVPQTADDLLRHNCLFGPIFQNHWPLGTDGSVKRVHVHGNITSNYSELLRQLALAGVGVARLADFHVRDDIAAGRLVPILTDDELAEEEPLYALYHRNRSLLPRVKTFVDFLAAGIGPLLKPT